MTNQLIISKGTFLDGIVFLSKDEENQYILDYLEISSIFLRNMKHFSYRKRVLSTPLRGETLRSYFMKNLVCSRGKTSLCFDVGTGDFIKNGSPFANQVLNQISQYVGVVYHNN